MSEEQDSADSEFVWDDEPSHLRSNWSGNSTPPDVYGTFSRQKYPSEDEDAVGSEPTIEDESAQEVGYLARPGVGLDGDHPDYGESGDFNVSALEPLRRSLEKDWSDIEVRDRLRDHTPRWAAPPSAGKDSTAAVGIKEQIPSSYKEVNREPSRLSGGAEVEGAPPQEKPADAGRVPKKTRWLSLVIAGGVLSAMAIGTPPAWYLPAPPAIDQPRFILTSEPKAQVYKGQVLLGTTPLLLDVADAKDELTLKNTGYEPSTFIFTAQPDPMRVEKIKVRLAAAPVALNWDGLPEHSTIFWNEVKTGVEDLRAVAPGTYRLKIIVKDRPAVETSVVVAGPGAKEVETTEPGAVIKELLARQPMLSLSVDFSKVKKPKLPIKVSIFEVNKKNGFKREIPFSDKATSEIVFSNPGVYQLKVAASASYLAYAKKLTIKEGAKEKVRVALKPVPEKVAAPVSASAPASGGYSAPPAYYPPPRPYSGGGGGGGGRIAPPSF